MDKTNSPSGVWIRLDANTLINLNYVIKVARTMTKTTFKEGLMFFHNSSGTASGQFVEFSSAAVADQKFLDVSTILDRIIGVTDLRE